MHPETLNVPWDAAAQLSDATQVKEEGRTRTVTEQAAGKIQRTIGLLRYGIAQRLARDASDRSKKYTPYPPEAVPDAIAVLGCLRPVTGWSGPWILWQRLYAISRSHPIDEDNSPEVAACLRALGQIDIPAARLMVDRIASEWAPEQQRAATYALSKIMGRYSIDFITEAITQRQTHAADADKDEIQLDREQAKRLRAMLQLGKDKGWFQGEYYGYNNSHAYDLIFADEPPKASANTK